MQHRMRKYSDVALNVEVSISAQREILFPSDLKLLAVPRILRSTTEAQLVRLTILLGPPPNHFRAYLNPF